MNILTVFLFLITLKFRGSCRDLFGTGFIESVCAAAIVSWHFRSLQTQYPYGTLKHNFYMVDNSLRSPCTCVLTVPVLLYICQVFNQDTSFQEGSETLQCTVWRNRRNFLWNWKWIIRPKVIGHALAQQQSGRNVPNRTELWPTHLPNVFPWGSAPWMAHCYG